MSSCEEVVASPPRRRGSQAQAPWRHGSHGAVDVVGPVAYPVAQGAVCDLGALRREMRGLPGRARGRGDAGVYTDRRKRPLGAVSEHLCTLLHPRAVSGGTSASTAMVCRRRPIGIRTPAASSDVPGPSRGPSGCPRRRRLTGPARAASTRGTTGPVWSRRPAHFVRLPSARPSRPFHHGAETVLQLRVCHILPCFTPVRARGRRRACPGPRAREATPTHPSA